jgi:alpha-glucosidase
VLGNHDKARIASRIGEAQARVAAMLLLTLRGTPTIYYGEEIGMQNVPIPRARVQDPAEKNQHGIGMGRDPERTPMPWDSSLFAGFTTGKPWLPIGADHGTANVAALSQSPESTFNLYRRLIELRRENDALTSGQIDAVRSHGNVLMYERRLAGETLTIVLNLGGTETSELLPRGLVLLSTYLDRGGKTGGGNTALRPNEGIILRQERFDEN